MNYLAHYYCDYPQNRPCYVLGLILPDLLRETSGKRVHLHPDHLPDSSDARYADLTSGILRHLEIDLFFHNSDWFHAQCEYTKKLFDDRTFYTVKNRIWIFAHILVELLMDRVLISWNPGLTDEFYELLSRVDHDELKKYFEQSSVEVDPEYVSRRLSHFLEDRYLYRYPDNDMMLFALNVLNKIIGNSAIDERDKPALIECIELTESNLRQDRLSIFEELKTQNA